MQSSFTARLSRNQNKGSPALGSVPKGPLHLVEQTLSLEENQDLRRLFYREPPVQTQLTVRLPDDLSRALKAASRDMQRKSSDVVRLALRQFFAIARTGRGRPADRVRHLVGSLESGVPDLAQKHRAYIVKSLKNAR